MNAPRAGSSSTLRQFGGYEKALRSNAAELRAANFEAAISSIPSGKVATYGQVAEAAGYPRYHRAVARFLADMYLCDLPWQRVVGAGGEIKVPGKFATLQRSLLKGEGVTFNGKRIDMAKHGHIFEL